MIFIGIISRDSEVYQQFPVVLLKCSVYLLPWSTDKGMTQNYIH